MRCPTCGHQTSDVKGPPWKQKLEDLRIAAGMSRADFAKKAGMSRQGYYTMFGDEDRGIRVDTLQRLCNVLGVTLAELFTEES